MGLGYLGLGDAAKAKAELSQAVETSPDLLGARTALRALEPVPVVSLDPADVPGQARVWWASGVRPRPIASRLSLWNVASTTGEQLVHQHHSADADTGPRQPRRVMFQKRLFSGTLGAVQTKTLLLCIFLLQ
jgi:hypothetical protein